MSYGKIPQVRDQIVYLPRGDDTPDSECELGFVVELPEFGVAQCRFWIMEGGKPSRELRTKANSERCDIESLKVRFFRNQGDIDAICDAFGWAKP